MSGISDIHIGSSLHNYISKSQNLVTAEPTYNRVPFDGFLLYFPLVSACPLTHLVAVERTADCIRIGWSHLRTPTQTNIVTRALIAW